MTSAINRFSRWKRWSAIIVFSGVVCTAYAQDNRATGGCVRPPPTGSFLDRLPCMPNGVPNQQVSPPPTESFADRVRRALPGEVKRAPDQQVQQLPSGSLTDGVPSVPTDGAVVTSGITPFQDWQLVCSSGQGGCAFVQGVFRPDRTPLLTLLVVGTGSARTLWFITPHGVALESGLTLSIGTSPPRRLAIDVCHHLGCLASVSLDAGLVRSLRESSKADVVVMAENGTGTRIAFSLAGFSDGFRALESRPGVPTVQGLTVSFPTLEPVQSFDAGAPPTGLSVNETYGDWSVQCVDMGVQSMAPCQMTQRTVNASTKQGLMSFSIAHAPFQDVYAFLVIVPTGVAIAPGLVVMADGRPLQDTAGHPLLQDVKYDVCENNGCYVKMGLQPPTMAALSAAASSGQKTAVFVAAYGRETPTAFPVSSNGFLAALERMRGLARERAVSSPSITPPFWK